ncbi:hypothetical protein AB1N83_007498 [Pleurotus pulmonarius]
MQSVAIPSTAGRVPQTVHNVKSGSSETIEAYHSKFEESICCVLPCKARRKGVPNVGFQCHHVVNPIKPIMLPITVVAAPWLSSVARNFQSIFRGRALRP